ncbi:MAG: TrkA C-terminal domain-containing protein [Rhodobacteraceae bacterium]|uniref:TrkA C-terminal domain-containing protein n=1 Tax=Marivita sp. TaxID=2003365 RepID=UPI003B517502|nr:TrkA C-terminal domain-containing protein [Paracoccaceae bacterium]
MTALASFLVIIALSLFVVRLGTIALVMTGLSEEIARFQALSAFSGAGYTTSEAESVLVETARRRVIMLLIRAGSVGAVSTIATAVLTFVTPEENALQKLIGLLIGCAGIILLARSDSLSRWATPIIRRGLQRFTTLELRDYAGLLRLQKDWQIAVIEVEKDSWLSGRSIEALDLEDEGVKVLGIERKEGNFLGAPATKDEPGAGDRLIVYGKDSRLKELRDRRKADEAAHDQAKREHAEEKSKEQSKDRKDNS